jgi:hypothetical protein
MKFPALKFRGRLFTKYVALLAAVVCIALLINGLSEIWFLYQEHKTSLIRIQREQAEAASAKISQFVEEIEAGPRSCRGSKPLWNSVESTQSGCCTKCRP